MRKVMMIMRVPCIRWRFDLVEGIGSVFRRFVGGVSRGSWITNSGSR